MGGKSGTKTATNLPKGMRVSENFFGSAAIVVVVVVRSCGQKFALLMTVYA